MIGGRWGRALPALAALVVSLAPGSPANAQVQRDNDVRQGAPTIDIQIPGDIIVGRPSVIEFRATNPAQDASQGSITVSLSAIRRSRSCRRPMAPSCTVPAS